MDVTSRVTAPPMSVRTLLGTRGRTIAVIMLLPLFVGTFHYTTDILPLFVLSKLWPFLMLPAALLGLALLDLPGRTLYCAALAYLVSVPPMMASAYLGSSLVDAQTITVKIVPLTFFFSLPWVLAWLRISAPDLRRGLVFLGLLTFGLLALLWVIVPQSMYRNEFGIDTIFLGGDTERGDRIQMPLFFGLLLIFYLGRQYASRLRLLKLVQIVICFGLMLSIFKERIPIVVSFAIVVLNVMSTLMRSRLRAFLLLACATLAFATAGFMLAGTGALTDHLGGSLSIRIDTVQMAWAYIREDPLRWLFGVGATTKYAAFTLNQMFRNPSFYLADIGWPGVMFEDGLVGAALLASLFAIGISITHRASRQDDILSLAIVDHTLYIAAASLIYSPTLLPGEIATLTALAIFLHRARPPARSDLSWRGRGRA